MSFHLICKELQILTADKSEQKSLLSNFLYTIPDMKHHFCKSKYCFTTQMTREISHDFNWGGKRKLS